MIRDRVRLGWNAWTGTSFKFPEAILCEEEANRGSSPVTFCPAVIFSP